MARIKLAYIGGGSTRAPGTMASIIHQGENFQGSEIVLIDFNEERLQLVKTIADKMAHHRGIDLRISYTTNRRDGLRDCDAVLSSYRPGGFEARYYDEAIPRKHGVIGQETQGPGGFFMALRSIWKRYAHRRGSLTTPTQLILSQKRLAIIQRFQLFRSAKAQLSSHEG
jgi:6-phospho-beta-glucosidase